MPDEARQDLLRRLHAAADLHLRHRVFAGIVREELTIEVEELLADPDFRESWAQYRRGEATVIRPSNRAVRRARRRLARPPS